MRKLTSKAEEAKKRKRNQLILGLILVAVMIFSVLGYGFQSQGGTDNNKKDVNYKGYSFKSNGNYWMLQIGESQFAFQNTPKNGTIVQGEIPPVTVYNNQPLYVYSENQEAEFEIYNNLNQFLLRKQYACLDLGNVTINTAATSDCEKDWPIKTCDDNFLIIEESDDQEIFAQNHCVFIKAPRDKLVETADEFLFETIGVK